MHNYQEYLINLFHKMIMKDSYIDRNITINSQKRFKEKEKKSKNYKFIKSSYFHDLNQITALFNTDFN